MIDTIKNIIEKFFPEENISKSKEKWNKLAYKNAKFYIVSRVGEGIDEEEFKKIGQENYGDLILNDSLLKEKLGSFKDKRVLDIGCGIGRLSELFGHDFQDVYGIDISEKMVEEGEKRLASAPNIHLHATDGLHFPFEDNFFDFIFSFVVFHHMPSREVVEQNLREVYRTLKKDGIAKIQIRGGKRPYRWQWYHGQAFKKEEALEMLNKIGFKVLKTEGEQTKLFWLWLSK